MEQLFDNTMASHLPNLKSTTDYWMIRADGGTYFNDFLLNNYVGVGWNEVNIKDISDSIYNPDVLRTKLISLNHMQNNTKNKKTMGSAARQLIRFYDNIQIDDTIIVPSENSLKFAVGIVISDVYEESDTEKTSEFHCPFKKRRKIEWKGTFYRVEADPAFQKIVYAAHTISKVNEYKKYINRALYDTYIEDEQMHMTFRVNKQNGIKLDALVEFLSTYQQLAKLIAPDEEIEIRINLQSPGPIELVGYVLTLGSAAAIIWRNTNIPSMIKGKVKTTLVDTLKYGGKASVSKDGVSIELPNRIAEENKQKNSERELKMKEEKHEQEMISLGLQNAEKALELVEKFGSNFSEMDAVFPEEFSKVMLKEHSEASEREDKD